MNRVVIFANKASNDIYPFPEIEDRANQWLVDHPGSVILESHTKLHVHAGGAIDFVLTLIVDIPERGKK